MDRNLAESENSPLGSGIKSRSVTENNMFIIKKKIWPEYFEAVASGKKKFELRLNDFEINEGDLIVLEEWDPETKEYTGRKIEKKATYVLKCKVDELFWPAEDIKEKGIQIISLE